MLGKLKLVLEKLREANLTLKPSKCSFGAKQIEFLGFVVGEGMIRPGRDKTEAIRGFPPPHDVHSVRRFLGLTGFFRRFVYQYASVAEPLTRLTKKGALFLWEEDQKTAFESLKGSLTNAPVLNMFNPKAAITEVHTDASSLGLGAMLLQSGDGVRPLQLVYCISKRLTEPESKYHSSKLELMCVVWAVNKWRHFLIGKKFMIITDCQALVYLKTHRDTHPQIQRWHDLLLEYDFDIQHRAGTKMTHVDALSRAPVDGHEEETLDEVLSGRLDVCVSLEQQERILMVQVTDEEIQKLIDILKKPEDERSKAERGEVRHFMLQGQLLYRNHQGKLLFVMPRSMRKSVVVASHDLNGHLSVDKTVSNILQDYWFVGLRRYVKQHIYMCMECLMSKKPRGRRPGLLHPIPVAHRPFEVVNMDHVGPFVRTARGERYILVMVDNLTKYVCLYAARDTSTEDVLIHMSDFVQRYGLPRRLITDRGTCFTSHAFHEYCEKMGIYHVLNSTRRPQANGQVERINSVVLSMLITQIEEHADWAQLLGEVQRQINNSESKVSCRTPFELLHGYRPRFFLGPLRELSTTSEEWTCPAELWEEAKTAVEKSQEKTKKAFDAHRHNHIHYKVGEIVVMTRVPTATGESTKLQDRYRGPLVVVEVLPGDVYRVEKKRKEKNRHYITTAHVSQLKSWKVIAEDQEMSDGTDITTVGDSTPKEVDFQRPAEEQEMPDEIKTVTEEDLTPKGISSQRPVRTKRKPAKFSDYVSF